MSSSRTISLFSERPAPSQKPSSFLASVAAHAAAIGAFSLGILYTPPNQHRTLGPHDLVRQLELHSMDRMPRKAGGEIAYPGPAQPMQKPSAGGRTEPQTAAPRLTAEAEKGPQTLLQPDILRPLHLKEEIQIPTLAIWTPSKQIVKTIVAPRPQPPTAAAVKPSVRRPTPEVNLADLPIASADTPLKARFLQPSTTSPVVVRAPERVQMAPVTAAQTKAEPTPTAVLSLSNVRMTDGHVALPPVNEAAAQGNPAQPATGAAADPARKGAGSQAAAAGGSGAGKDPSQAKGPSDASTQRAPDSALSPGEAKQGANGDSGSGGTSVHFSLPRDGQFGAVIVGSSMQEQFPEIADVWNARMAYTVYLHVGLPKSWILQYSLPRAAEAAAEGNIARLDAPWPYTIVRPNLAPGSINADALMVHGFVNQAGRFESLAVAFPAEFAQAQYVLGALEQWQFRPAAQNGRLERVEVVLIIPEEEE